MGKEDESYLADTLDMIDIAMPLFEMAPKEFQFHSFDYSEKASKC